MTCRPQMFILISLLMCVVALAGCGPSTPQLTPVKGRVLFRGQPLPYGTIVFVPDSTRGTRGNIAVAEIQRDGTFTLKTDEAFGAVAGHHKVTVSCIHASGAATPFYAQLPTKY